ncbi:MAG: rod shape-determining protein MreC [Candidatus Daviesbacteria bacterium]|nr:rod shape-determining protein MreC [Candidatus Daviesbacteria bacterium]
MLTLLADFKAFLPPVIISCLLLFLDYFKVLDLPKMLVQTLTSPIQYGVYHMGILVSDQVEFITSSRQAAQENKALRFQLSELLLENSKIQTELSEAKVLVEQKDVLGLHTYEYIPAKVLSSGRFLVVDQGSLDGVKVGQPVIFKDSFVGLVSKVNPKISQITLPYDPESKIPVFSQGKDGKARGIVQGKFGSDLLMDKILHQESISIDDLIYTDGSEGVLPRGLIVGKVIKVLDRPNEIFKQAEVESLFHTRDLPIVFIIKN